MSRIPRGAVRAAGILTCQRPLGGTFHPSTLVASTRWRELGMRTLIVFSSVWILISAGFSSRINEVLISLYFVGRIFRRVPQSSVPYLDCLSSTLYPCLIFNTRRRRCVAARKSWAIQNGHRSLGNSTERRNLDEVGHFHRAILLSA